MTAIQLPIRPYPALFEFGFHFPGRRNYGDGNPVDRRVPQHQSGDVGAWLIGLHRLEETSIKWQIPR